MLPIVSPEEYELLGQAMVGAEAALTPGDPDEIVKLFAAIATIHPDSKLTDAEELTRLKIYRRTLADLPADLCSKAFFECAQNNVFFPKPAELRKTIAGELFKRRSHLLNIRRLRFKHELDYLPPAEGMDDPPAEGERDEFNANMRAAGAKMRMNEDGSLYQLKPGEDDPAPRPPAPPLETRDPDEPVLPL
jgi:hypothetical protein